MEKLSYPYNFVSLGDEKEINKERQPIEKGENTGKLVCSLINKTPLSIEDTKNIIIPASSLKGEIRNVIEVLTTSCIRVDIKNKSLYEKVPENFRTCSNTEELCFACRLFGSTGNEEKNENSYKGRVYFSDAVLNVEYKKKIEFIKMKLLLEKPRIDEENALEKYYISSDENDENKIRGRKFYWHHTEKIKAGKGYKNYLKTISDTAPSTTNSTIWFLRPDQDFEFEVSFKDLTDEELGILIYSLELEKDLLHKLGKAKAFGFGSCEIKITDCLLESSEKYSSFIKAYEKIDKEKYLKIAKEKYKLDTDERKEIKELKAILKSTNNLDFKESPYPEDEGNLKGCNTVNWFMNNKGCVLPTILDYTKKK